MTRLARTRGSRSGNSFPVPSPHLAPVEGRRGNVFIVGYNEHQHRHVERLDPDGHFAFHTLISSSALRRVRAVPVVQLLDEAEASLDRFGEPVDAIVSFMDFPGIEIAALLAARRNLPGPSLEAVLKCNHKLWERRLQAEVSPETTPRFTAVDPFHDGALAELEGQLRYPFWIKPFNGYASYLGFRVNEPDDALRAFPFVREGIGRLARPLERLMALADVPEDLRRLGGWCLIAEEIVSGEQCTLEGYVHRGTPRIYGVVDSIRESNGISFARYEYPSRLPAQLQERMARSGERVMRHLGLDDGAFNIEFYFDPSQDHLWLLEVNPRLSQSHLELFEKVDGASHQKAAIELALGRAPEMPRGRGEYPFAAKYFLRAWEDARITRVPGRSELERIQREVPGTSILLRVDEGMRLSEVSDQDSYSYELAWIWIGGRSREDLTEKHRAVTERLDIRSDPL